MVQQVFSRSQRRMERKQAVVLLGVALGVALVSFCLGVMVGRGSSSPSPNLQPVVQAPLPAVPAPRPAPPETAPAPVSVAPVDAAPGEGAEKTPPAGDKLTFYDTLPRGDQPLGSGINLPPATEQKTPEAPAAPAAPTAQASSASAAVKAAPAPVAKAAAPAGNPGSGYVLQVASFRDAEGAEAFRQKLAAKGYPQYTESADLGAKGTWYRVYVGPVASKEAAEAQSRRLQEQEKITPLLRKR